MFSGFFPAGFAAFRRFPCCAGRRRFPFGAKKNAARQGGTIPPLPLRRPNAKNRPKAAFPAFLAGSGVFPFLHLFFACYRRLGTFEAVNAQ